MSRLHQQRPGGQQHTNIKKKQNKISSRTHGKSARQKVRGPRLPFSLRRELHLESRPHSLSHDKQDSHEGEEEEEEEAEESSKLPTSDIYEYEEDQAPEELGKNRRFDDVDRLEYELPSDFEDEEIDEGAADGEDPGLQDKKVKQQKPLGSGKKKKTRKWQTGKMERSNEDITSDSDQLDLHREDEEDGKGSIVESDGLEASKHIVRKEIDRHVKDKDTNDNISALLWDGDADETGNDSDADARDVEDDYERHQRMLEAVRTPRKKEQRGKRPKQIELVSEAYPESEFNINPSADDSSSKHITIEDLMAPLQSTTGFGSLRKRMHQLQKRNAVVDVPLPKVVQERLARKAGYEKSSEEISKWQDLVKKNREAPSLVFTSRPDLTAASTAELVSKFEPCTRLEKEIASLLQQNGLAEDTSETITSLGFNKLTMDEVKERQERLAKMRSILSHHEAKAKRMKKIKSKAYHRLLQRDRKGKIGHEGELDSESLKEAAVKAEYRRAQERMTLKHKNTSKWAKRIIKRGLKVKEDGSREALAEQLRTHSALTRKIKSIDNASTSDDSSDENDTDSDSMDERSGPSQPTKSKSKLLAKAKVETLKVLEGDAEAEIPKTGLFGLPFMARAIEKKRQQAQNEAIAVLEQLEQLEYDNENGIKDFDFGLESEDPTNASAGRLAFGDMAKSLFNGQEQEPDMLLEDGSSSDDGQDKDVVTLAGETILAPSKKGKTKVVKISDMSNGLGYKTAATSSKKRKTEGSKNLNTSHGLESKAQNHNMADGAWTEYGIPRATALTDSGLNNVKDAGNLVDVCESRSFNVGIDNPWLYGTRSQNESMTATVAEGDDRAATYEDAGPLVASASTQVVRIAGGNKTLNIEIEAPTNMVMSDPTIEVDVGQAKALTTRDSEEEDDNLKEQSCHFSLENASQAELIQRAFAGDDVEADFEQMKSDAVNKEEPLGEAAPSLPGWGQWTDVQKKRGPPLWIVKQEEELKWNRQKALNNRKDSKLRHVIISERMDRKAEKFMLPTLPFPFKSKDVFEKSIRMPIGRDFNTDQAFRDMIRPAVVKDAGVLIAPVKFEMSDTKNDGAVLNSDDNRKSKRREDSVGGRGKRSKGDVSDKKAMIDTNVHVLNEVRKMR